MGIDLASGSPIVRLVEVGGTKAARELPIWIGPFEAQAIAMEIQGVPAPRPMTHDLLKHVIEQLGGTLREVVIEDLRGTTYFASLHLDGPEGKGVEVDARPSDAIALALRLHGRILVAEDLFAKAASSEPAPTARHLWGLTVQDLTPEVATFFRVPARQGVLVADVATSAAAHEVARGDVITAVDGDTVGTVGELVDRADRRSVPDPVRLTIRREGHDVTVTFAEK